MESLELAFEQPIDYTPFTRVLPLEVTRSRILKQSNGNLARMLGTHPTDLVRRIADFKDVGGKLDFLGVELRHDKFEKFDSNKPSHAKASQS
jgi:hypothetical protein